MHSLFNRSSYLNNLSNYYKIEANHYSLYMKFPMTYFHNLGFDTKDNLSLVVATSPRQYNHPKRQLIMPSFACSIKFLMVLELTDQILHQFIFLPLNQSSKYYLLDLISNLKLFHHVRCQTLDYYSINFLLYKSFPIEQFDS